MAGKQNSYNKRSAFKSVKQNGNKKKAGKGQWQPQHLPQYPPHPQYINPEMMPYPPPPQYIHPGMIPFPPPRQYIHPAMMPYPYPYHYPHPYQYHHGMMPYPQQPEQPEQYEQPMMNRNKDMKAIDNGIKQLSDNDIEEVFNKINQDEQDVQDDHQMVEKPVNREPVNKEPIIKKLDVDFEINHSDDGLSLDDLQDAAQDAAQGDIADGKGFEIDNLEEFIPLPKRTSTTDTKIKTKKSKKIEQRISEESAHIHKAKENIAQDALNDLAAKFDNVLDKNVQEPAEDMKDAKAKNKKYLLVSDKQKSIIIRQLIPDSRKNNWNNVTHPKEGYTAIMMDGNVKEYLAEELNDYTLETHKYINQHNDSFEYKKPNQNSLNSNKAFIYARCSNANDTSIETQIKACLLYARKKGLKLLPFGCQYDNGVSGRKMNNLEYELGVWAPHLEQDTHLIIYSVDRLSRSLLKGLQFLETMAARGVTVHFVTNELVCNNSMSAAAQSMVQMELQAAEKVSNQTSEKVRATIKRKREEGHVIGNAPYGYKNIKIDGLWKRDINNDEQRIIKHIFNLYNRMVSQPEQFPILFGYRITNKLIINEIIRDCNRKGLRRRNQTPFTPSSIYRIICNQEMKYTANLVEDVVEDADNVEDIEEDNHSETDLETEI